MSAIPSEDFDLVCSALGGDRAAISGIAARTKIVPRILKALNGRWGRPLTAEDVEDLSQDVVLAVLKKLENYRGLSPLDAWLYRFCLYQMRNRVRREVRRHEILLDTEVEDAFYSDVTDRLDGERMWTYVEALEPRDQQIMRAKHIDGMSFGELSKELGLQINSAKTRYYRALKQLRARVHASVGEEA